MKKNYFVRGSKIEQHNCLSELVQGLITTSENFGLNYCMLPCVYKIDLIENFQKQTDQNDTLNDSKIWKFHDKKQRKCFLAPDYTSLILKLKQENPELLKQNFFYLQSTFRYEKPQKFRKREFKQFGVELFGDTIKTTFFLLLKILDWMIRRFDVKKKIFIHANVLNENDIQKIKNFFIEKTDCLCDKCKKRKNFIRILECDLCKEKMDFSNNKTKKQINSLNDYFQNRNSLVEFKYDYRIVRGMDYYRTKGIVFELKTEDNSTKKTSFCGGGEYEFRDARGSGFAFGLERIIKILHLDLSVIEIRLFFNFEKNFFVLISEKINVFAIFKKNLNTFARKFFFHNLLIGNTTKKNEKTQY